MTDSPTPVEQYALKVAHASVLNSRNPAYDLVSQVVFALGGAQLLQSPESAAEDAIRHQRTGVALTVARLRDRARDIWTPADLLALLDEMDAAPLIVYRAECDTIPLGTYQSREAARDHCRVQMERAEPDRVGLHWVPINDDEPDGQEELACIDADGVAVATDFFVTPITVPAAYDSEGDDE